MADNYLEKQYETYQARKAAWERERKYGKKHSPTKQIKKVEKPAEPKEATSGSSQENL